MLTRREMRRMCEMSKPIDWDKPLETVQHSPARLLHKLEGDSWPYPYVVLISPRDGGYEHVTFLDGHGDNGVIRIQNTPEAHEVWVNVYRNPLGGCVYGSNLYSSRERADREAHKPRRIACKKIVLREGEYDE